MSNADGETILLKLEDWQKVVADLRKLRAEVRLLKKRIKELEAKEAERANSEWIESMGDDI